MKPNLSISSISGYGPSAASGLFLLCDGSSYFLMCDGSSYFLLSE